VGLDFLPWSRVKSLDLPSILYILYDQNQLYNLENLNIPYKVSQAVDEIVTDAVDWPMQAPLRVRFRDLPTVDMKEILQQRMFADDSYKAHTVHNDLYEALQKSLELDYSNQRLADQEEARAFGAPGTLDSSRSSQLPPPPLPPSTGTSAQQQGNKAPSSSKTAASTSQSMAWTTSDTRFESTGFTAALELSPTDYLMQDDSIPKEQVHLFDDEDSENYHQPKADSRKDWWKPLPEEERTATPEPAWTIPSSNKSDVADFEGQAYEVVKAFYPDVIHLQFQMEECHKMLITQDDWMNPEGDHVRIDVNRPMPLGGPPGHVTIQPQFFFNKDLEYLRYGSKGSNPALSVSKMKAASYLDFGLELLVPEQMWIDDVCTYDISAKYGISTGGLIDRSSILTDMILRRNMYPSDFEDVNLLLLQGHLDHLPGSDKRMLSTAVKQWTRNLVIQQRVEDFQLGIESYQTQLNFNHQDGMHGYELKHVSIIESLEQ
ncbi:hypothetical protein Tco_1195002, partial [Tanacetum coccineum]